MILFDRQFTILIFDFSGDKNCRDSVVMNGYNVQQLKHQRFSFTCECGERMYPKYNRSPAGLAAVCELRSETAF